MTAGPTLLYNWQRVLANASIRDCQLPIPDLPQKIPVVGDY
ncbi:MAG: hypothetical protein ACTJG1_13560 [Enterococcus gilvus]